MLDFLMISEKRGRGFTEIFPDWRVDKRNDLLTKGGDFYAVWNEETGLWSRNELDALLMIDKELDKYAEEWKKKHDETPRVLHCCRASTKMINSFHEFCKKQLRDSSSSIILDQKLIFSNQKTKKRDYASKVLPYPLEEGPYDAYDQLMSALYSPEERDKLEWAIGSIVAGDSVNIQKFVVLYGAAGTGKSTVLSIIESLFEGYCTTFDAKALGSSNKSFALEPFINNPLVAIQHDGDLSGIEDNTRLNSLVSHEWVTMNVKYLKSYPEKIHAFLFMGTNRPVKITDARSGLLRRLIDVSPTGNKLPLKEYNRLKKQISFEKGAIAWHCREVYLKNPNRYDDYIPLSMMSASNDFYNYISEYYSTFKESDSTTLTQAWGLYKQFCEDANVKYPFSRRVFQEELKNYFRNYEDRHTGTNGSRTRNYYSGFRTEKFEQVLVSETKPSEEDNDWIDFKEQHSILDDVLSEQKAQYASKTERQSPTYKWDNVKTTLKDLDTHRLHYTLMPENHIVIDFDIPGDDGGKDLQKNLEEANKWPPTYAELSKSGAGIHLHYIYSGDASMLSSIYDDHIEVKTFAGKSSLRRKLTKCNDLPIATINSGLPMKGDKKVVDQDILMNEKGLRTFIKRNLQKEYHGATKPSIDFIYDQLEKQYASGQPYDVSNMISDVTAFAMSSTHQSEYCLKKVKQMHFKSESYSEPVVESDKPIAFYDIEVFPNLLLVNYKVAGPEKPMTRLINPTSSEIEAMLNYRLIGFNCRRYDNHILYARLLGYSNEEIYGLSQRIISGDRRAFFGEAYNLSYTDVYDFSAKKQSLKKWEVELKIHHLELGLPWDQPVPEDRWPEVAKYCDNDVLSTEAVFDHLKGDWTARLILADVADMCPNDTTNMLTQRIIFGKDKNPQTKFNYRNLGDESDIVKRVDDITCFDSKGRPVFPGYLFENGKSTYLGYEIGEGGLVMANEGMYGRTISYDISSMHPSSARAEQLFGPYTKNFEDIIDARIAIKHNDFASAKNMLGGKLAKYLGDPSQAKALAGALKIAINSVYGLTAAKFDNAFRDSRNVDNIVAKRGALFMANLKTEVERKGYTVVHIKTDSIKVANPDEDIQKFIYEYGAMYGYSFEIEHVFEKICLLNKAVYIAKLADDDPESPGEWTGTGDQVKKESSPYVFKRLFSKEPIDFYDMCETMSVTTALYLDMNEELPEGEHFYHFVGKVGQFTPVLPGCGGGWLVREGKDKNGNPKYDSATGAKGYRWLESEMVKTLGLEDKVDRTYYDTKVDQLRADLSKFGDVEQFISDDKQETGHNDYEMDMLLASVMPW